ncbi:MAG: transglutaminase domain-containing protein [Oscillospiraceae bacterium]|nr:transglutaminase domain-containing protein [Oscillospiraceae bacterium]
MKNGLKNAALLCAGMILGAALFSGTAAYAASGIFAEKSPCAVYVDGRRVELDAYLIDGRNYVQLRDIGKATNALNVYCDGAVQIESGKPYTGEAPASPAPQATVTPSAGTAAPAASEDYATQANAAIFSGAYTREAYNALRQTVVSGADSEAVTMTEATRTAMDSATAAIGEWPGYHLKSVADGKTAFTAKYPSTFQQAADYCQSFIEGLAGKSDRDKAREIAFYVCDRLTYDAGSTSTPRTALVDDAVHMGNCMSYASNFLFLCDMADIPCVFVHSSTHQWNQVYVDGRWWSVDVSSTDAGDDTASRNRSKVLFEDADMQGRIFRQTQPEQTAFIKEVLVPGSTK